jgi:hypothetical protein
MDDVVVKKNLIPVIIEYHSDNIWSFTTKENFFPSFKFKGTPNRVKSLLKVIRAKDSVTYPNSYKGTTYQEMLDFIITNGIFTIFVWRSKYPKSQNDINLLIGN